MDIEKYLVILKGKDKTDVVQSYEYTGGYKVNVRFYKTNKTYTYLKRDFKFYLNPVEINIDEKIKSFLKKYTVKTVMGEVTYKRAIYLETINGKTRYMFLLDETLHIAVEGKISQNLAETALEVVVNSTSYRKAAENLNNSTNETISHEALRNLAVSIGGKIEKREKEEIRLMKRNQLIKGIKEIPALFEETDELRINLQGKDRALALEKQRHECEKKGKKFNPQARIKTELKLHVMYEDWKENDSRHETVNKKTMAGVM